MLQNTKGPGRIAYGWEDHYSVRPNPSETFLHDCLCWNPFFDSSIKHFHELDTNGTELVGVDQYRHRFMKWIFLLSVKFNTNTNLGQTQASSIKIVSPLTSEGGNFQDLRKEVAGP